MSTGWNTNSSPSKAKGRARDYFNFKRLFPLFWLFSTKTHIAMPTTLTEEDQSRLESLCMLFGVGLVLFDLDKDEPQFSIRVHAQRFSPDMFYVNEFADRLKHHDAEIFEELFG